MSLQHSPSLAASKPPSRRSKLRNALLMLVVGIVVAFFAAEIALRVIIFHSGPKASHFERRMRQPARYSDGNNEDDYWKLVCAINGEAGLNDADNPDPITGWTGGAVTPGTYEHIDEGTLGARRPVLLYGDSFAACGTPAEDCFQSLLERSEFGGQYALLNYGVGGYGLDQTYLLLKNSIGRFEDRDPIVIVSILVDSDLERSVLEFRSWPKPRLDVVGNQLVSRGLVQTNNRQYLEQRPVSIRSYLWRLFLYQMTPFMADQRARWRGDEAARTEKQSLNRKILLEIEHELSSRNLEHFFMVFHAEDGALERWNLFEWQERMIEEFCAEKSIPLFDTRAYLAFVANGQQEERQRFYGHGRPLLGHHNALGNLICFEAIRQGLSGNFGPPDMRHLRSLRRYGLLDSTAREQTSSTLLGKPVRLIGYNLEGRVSATETNAPHRLVLRSDELWPNVAIFQLGGETKRFTGRLHTLTNQDQGCSNAELRFTVTVDDDIVLECAVPPAANEQVLDIDLAGKRSMSLAIVGDRGAASCSWICIEDPRWE